MDGKKVRGLDDFAIKAIKNHKELNGVITRIRTNNPNNLILGIRNNYIDIYHRCSKVIEIPLGTKGVRKPKIDKTYEGSLGYEIDKTHINQEFIEKIRISQINAYLELEKNTPEKDFQHTIIVENNKLTDAKWFCVDLEYLIHRNSTQDKYFGRQDIIAISKEKNEKYKIAIIELKVGKDAFKKSGGVKDAKLKNFIDTGNVIDLNDKDFYNLGSGILGHFSNFVRSLDDSKYRDNKSRFEILKDDVVNIIKSYAQLGFGDKLFQEFASSITAEQIADYPEIIFLVYTDKDTQNIIDLKKEFKKYIFESSTEMSVEKLWSSDILNKYNGNDGTRTPMKVIFRKGKPQGALFSDVEISEAKNIFDEEAYK